jgi:hypothetical protein
VGETAPLRTVDDVLRFASILPAEDSRGCVCGDSLFCSRRLVTFGFDDHMHMGVLLIGVERRRVSVVECEFRAHEFPRARPKRFPAASGMALKIRCCVPASLAGRSRVGPVGAILPSK